MSTPETPTHRALDAFLLHNPELDLLRFDFNDPEAVHRLAVPEEDGEASLAAARAFQRARRVAPDDATARRLLAAGFDSAQRIAAMSEHRFVREHADLFGGDTAAARDTHRRAAAVRAQVQHVVANVHAVAGSPHFRSMLANPADPALAEYFTSLPSYADLFGGLDYCQCAHDQSIFGPAAYLLDLMRITEEYITDPNTHKQAGNIPAGYTLRERRPDLFELKLDARNTTTLVPLLRIVNDVLQRRLLAEQKVNGGTAQGGTATTLTLASGASDQDDAYTGMVVMVTAGTGVGQSAAITAYAGSTRVASVASAWTVVPDATSVYAVARPPLQTVAAAPFPFNLPANLPLTEIRASLGALGVSPAEVYTALAAPGAGGQAQGGTPATLVLAATAADQDGAYATLQLRLVGGTGAGQVREVASYTGATRTATVTQPWSPVPDATTQYQLYDPLPASREVLGLSIEQYSLATTPVTDPAALAPYYGMTTLDVARLAQLGVFLERTGLQRAQLVELLTQEMSTAELNAGLADLFFVNATGEGLPAMRIVTDGTDPNNPYEKIDNLTAKRLDRLNRFIRLAAWTRWPGYTSLDWAMKSVSATEIDRGCVIQLGRIRELQTATSLDVITLCALWSAVKNTGKGNGPVPIDLFDRVFNPPGLLAGQDPYTSVTPIPFDPARPLDWGIDATGQNGVIRGRLRGTLGVSDDDLTLLARFVHALLGLAPVQPLRLDLATLSWLFRLATAAQVFRLSVDEYLALLGLMYFPNLPYLEPLPGMLYPSPEGALAQLAQVQWFASTRFTVYSARYVVTGEASPNFTPPYDPASLATFIESLSAVSESSRVPQDAFAFADIDAADSAELFSRLVSSGFLTALGIVLTHTPRWYAAAAKFPFTAASFQQGGITAAEAAEIFTQLQESRPPILTALAQTGNPVVLAPGLTRDTNLSFLLPNQPEADNKRNEVRSVLLESKAQVGIAEFAFLFPLNALSLTGNDVPPARSAQAFAELQAQGVLVADSAGGEWSTVTAYDGATRTATVSPAWATAPGDATLYRLLRVAGSGTAQAASIMSVTLATTASAADGTYAGMEVAVTEGTGAGQRRAITLYEGATREATVATAWTVIPDATSGYTVVQTVSAGVSRGGTSTTAQLAAGASSTGGAYVGLILELAPSATLSPHFDAATPLGDLFASAGAGQAQAVTAYDGPARTATVGTPWTTAPDATTVYVITRVVSSGTAKDGGAAEIALADTASSEDGAYVGLQVSISGGTGAGQVREVSAYTGATKTAAVSRAWETAPDDTSVYALTEVAATGTARGGGASTLLLDAAASATTGDYVGLPLALVADPLAGVRQDAVRQRLLALRADVANTAALMDQAATLQEANAVQGLAGLLRTTTDRLAALIPAATRVADLSDYVDELLTPIVRGQVPPNVPPFVDGLSRGLVLADTVALADAEIRGVVARPAAFNLDSTSSATFAELHSLSTFTRLRAAFGDDRGALLAYLLLPPDAGCPGGVPGAQVRALAALTGWPPAQVCTLIARFWPSGMGATEYGYATVDGVGRLAAAFALGERVGMEVATLLALDALAFLPLVVNGSVSSAAWQTCTSLAGVARAAVRAAESGGAPGASATAMADLSRTLDEQERDALAPYTQWVLAHAHPELASQSALYQYLLIDVGMSGCDSVSPIAQAIASLQLYMQRSRMMLEPGVTDLPIPEVWWEWMSGYRLWEANRKIFLYPENYLDPARRSDATPQFRELVDELLQTDITDQTVTSAYDTYFAGFSEVASLAQCASYTCKISLLGAAEQETLFVFGRTATQPHVWYWRRFDGLFAWSPWQKVGLSIAARFVTPVYAFKRLFLFWTGTQTVDGSRVENSQSNTTTTTTAQLKFSFLNDDLTWAPEQTLDDVVLDYREEWVLPEYVLSVLPMAKTDVEKSYDPATVWWRKVYALYAPDVNPGAPSYPRGEQVMLSYGWALRFAFNPMPPQPGPPASPAAPTLYRFEYDAYSLVKRQAALSPKTPQQMSGYLQPVLNPMVDGGLTPSAYGAVLLNNQPILNPQPYYPLMNRATGAMGVSQSTTWNPIIDNFFSDDEPGVVSPTAGVPQRALLANVSGKTASIITVKNRVGSFLFDNGDETFLVVTSEPGISDISELLDARSNRIPFPKDPSFLYVYVNSYTTATPQPDFNTLTFSFYRLSTNAVRPLARKLRLGGVDVLLTLESQETPELPFSRLQPVAGVAIPPASDKLDFDGAYGAYFWEIFFHAPFLVGNSLGLNRRYDEARRWYEFIFNPTQEPAAGDDPNDTTRFWRFLPFRSMDIPTLTQILTNPAQIAAYNNRPFDPDAIARLRISAYAKAIVMRYIDHLLRWADDLFALDTRESITQATQLYVLAADLLGPRPENVGPCPVPAPRSFDEILAEYSDRTVATGTAQGGADRSITLASTASSQPDAYAGMQVSITAGTGSGQTNYITAYDAATRVATVEVKWTTSPDATSQYRVFVNGIPQFLIRVENSGPLVTPPSTGPAYQGVPFNDINSYFCVPENEELVAYWDRVEDRLFKIRHCMNLEGQVRTLAPFAPPIDPRQLIRAAAAGQLGGLSVLGAGDVAIPYYRFTVMLQKAQQLTSLVMQLGSSLLSALEKKDATALSLLRTSQERTLLDLTTLIKEQSLDEVVQTGLSLQESQRSAAKRVEYYTQQLARGLSAAEVANIASMTVATVFNVLAGATRTASSIGYAVPQVGSPFAMTYGGQQIGAALTAASGVFEIGGMLANFAAQLSLTMAGYERRAEEWRLQMDLAGFDRTTIGYQIAANQARQQIARRELEVHQASLRQNAEMEAFLTRSFTSEELYQWMAGRLSTVYFQTYSLAFALARSAERAWQFELGSSQTFVNFGYWDSLRKGLLAGEGLMLALSQMEKAYLDGTPRPLEIEKTVSLLQLNPRALLDLVRTGECLFELPEKLFDLDFPGHYLRNLKSVSISIPAVLGPYQNVHATLTQLSSQVVLRPDAAAVKYLLGVPGSALPGPAALRSNWWVNQQIALSRGADDSGVFVLNFSDERYLPFEGTGAVSTWRLSLPRATNRFDFSAISDVVVNLKYTARDGGARFRQEVTSLAPLRRYDGSPFFPMAQVFSTAWYDFLHLHPDPATQTLQFALAGLVPPHLGEARLTGFFVQLDLPPGVRGSGRAPYLRLKLGAGVDAQFNLDPYNRYLHTFQATPPVARAEGPGALAFTLAGTPAPLKGADGYLDPAVVRNVALVLFYSADMQW